MPETHTTHGATMAATDSIRKLWNQKSPLSGQLCQNHACSATHTAKRVLCALSLSPQNSVPTSSPRQCSSQHDLCHGRMATCRREGNCAGGLGKGGVFQLLQHRRQCYYGMRHRWSLTLTVIAVIGEVLSVSQAGLQLESGIPGPA